jgi:hypothetical protein
MVRLGKARKTKGNMENEQQDQQELQTIQPHTLELIQRAEIDMQVMTAKRYPRDLAQVKKRMLSFATLDEETAESCFYTLKRQGGGGEGGDEKKTIQGPSVRLAEIAVACYGNLRAASRIIDNDGKTITSQGVCHDLENNTLVSVEVKRRITRRDGRTYSEDMQVVTGNAANSIAFRNAVFKVIPGALTKPVYEAAKMVAVGTASTLQVKRDKVFKKLNAMGADNARILAALEKKSIENVDLNDLEALIGLGTAIRDGDTSVDEAFPATIATGTAMKTEKLKSNLAEAELAQRKAKQQSPEGQATIKSETDRLAKELEERKKAAAAEQQGQGNHEPSSNEGEKEEAGEPEPQEGQTQPIRIFSGAEPPDTLEIDDQFIRWNGKLLERNEDNTAWMVVPEAAPTKGKIVDRPAGNKGKGGLNKVNGGDFA